MLEEQRSSLRISAPTRNQSFTDRLLWGIVGAYLIGSIIFPGFITPLLFPFALIHGARRYGWKNIAVFIVATLAVSSVLESSSILNGFPLGHYYYTGLLGPKVGLIPVFVYVSYVSLGYLAWVLATQLVGEVRRNSSLLTTVMAPLIGSLMMVAWDLSADPIGSTIKHAWIWTQGGAYFGVPLSNFVGWFFILYSIFQLFALYQRQSGLKDLDRKLPRTHYLQVIVVYAWTGFGFVLSYLLRPGNARTADAAGHVWQTSDIYETTAISAICTMIIISLLALVILFRSQLTENNPRLLWREGLSEKS